MPIRNIDQKCIVITGASRGIGKALVNKALLDNHIVLAVQRQTTQPLKQKLKITGKLITLEVKDLADEDQLSKLIKNIELNTQKIDILINCAGVSSKSMREKKTTSEFGYLEFKDLTRMFQINSITPLLLAQGLKKKS